MVIIAFVLSLTTWKQYIYGPMFLRINQGLTSNIMYTYIFNKLLNHQMGSEE